jgi:hypothetical protein
MLRWQHFDKYGSIAGKTSSIPSPSSHNELFSMTMSDAHIWSHVKKTTTNVSQMPNPHHTTIRVELSSLSLKLATHHVTST